MSIRLTALEPFARGGNRLCFIHPNHNDRCIKVRRPDFTLADLRRKKGFPKNLRPLSSFDDNREEFDVMRAIDAQLGEPVYQVVSRCFGFEETDLGLGLSSELICDDDGRISRTLKQHIWDNGYSGSLQHAVAAFAQLWCQLGVPSRDLLVHNIVVQFSNTSVVPRLVVIDGLGSASAWPESWRTQSMRQRRSQRKVENLHQRIDTLLTARAKNEFPGTHGLLMHDGVTRAKTDSSSYRNNS